MLPGRNRACPAVDYSKYATGSCLRSRISTSPDHRPSAAEMLVATGELRSLKDGRSRSILPEWGRRVRGPPCFRECGVTERGRSRANAEGMTPGLAWIQGPLRQAEGIALAKAAGKYRGRARTLTADRLAQARAQIAVGVPKAKIARDLDVDRTTLYRTLAADPDSA